MAVSLNPTIDKLKVNNYPSWARDMKFVLLEKNCWGIVNGTETQPEADKDGKSISDFNARSQTALVTIYLNISAELKSIIEHYDSPRKAWLALKENLIPDSRSAHMSIYHQFLECYIHEGESIMEYSLRLSAITDELKNMGKPVDDVYISYQLLRRLPEKFSSVVQFLLRLKDDDFKYKKLVTELIAEETRLTLQDLELSDRSLNIELQQTSVKRRAPTKGLKRNVSKVVCFNCQKPGHYSTQCRSNVNSNFKSKSTNRNVKSYNKFSGKPDYHQPQFNYLADSLISECNLNSSDDSLRDCWVFDTAATHHFCRNRNCFLEYTPVKGEHMSVAVDGVSFPIIGRGIVQMRLNNKLYNFLDVLYSPKLRKNLISGPRLDKHGCRFEGKDGKISVYKADNFLFYAKLRNGIYYLSNPPITKFKTSQGKFQSFQPEAFFNTLDTWHKNFAHIGKDLIVHTSKHHSVKGLPELKHTNTFCKPCQLNKQRRVSFKPIEGRQSRHAFEKIFMDVWGPISEKGFHNEKYFLSIIDDYSRKIAIYPMQEKSQVFNIVQRHISRQERYLNTKLKRIRSDNGSEFDNQFFRKFCSDKGIIHEFTNKYTPEQNGVCERANQTILNCVRAMLADSGLDNKFWSEAVIHFAYTWNRICHRGQKKTPYELYHECKPTVGHLKPFGSIVYVGIPKPVRGNKLSPKSKLGIVVGYALKTKGYRVWIKDDNKIVETLNLKFDPEGKLYRSGAALGPITDVFKLEDFNLDFIPIATPQTHNLDQNDHEISEETETPDEKQDTPDTLQAAIPTTTWTRKCIKRLTGDRIDIYYYPNQSKTRIRSINEARNYCNKQNIPFDADIFDFSPKITFEGVVTPNCFNQNTGNPSTSAVNL